MRRVRLNLGLLTILFLIGKTFAQNVSVSPSRLYFNAGIGEYETQEVMVTNNSDKPQSFQVSFADFEARGNTGKSDIMKAGESEHSCADWLSASPSFFTLNAGESKKVKVLLQVPNTPEANQVKWAVMSIKLAHERTAPQEKGENIIGFGIVQTFQFIIHIFQSPPTVTYKDAQITSFKTYEKDGKKYFYLEVKNTGDAILDCASYIEITNLQNGESNRLDVKAFTVLPGTSREVLFPFPESLQPGKYSIMGVVDFGSDEKVEAAELELEI